MANKLKKELETEGNFTAFMTFKDNPIIKEKVQTLVEETGKDFSIVMRKLIRAGLEAYR